ncbi:hypothetical protein PhCBS80983_g00670 [Powellomyces hirtus]|uniref:AB hydrolase-1 domain-containing protein n=1 Tax=Powellomyces hirtus TaxID=109895 RepID=A0A507EFR5_9FUNG|nr:hypothetical protein PhCBS80983_g00670 [Powellomyces hirtus]
MSSESQPLLGNEVQTEAPPTSRFALTGPKRKFILSAAALTGVLLIALGASVLIVGWLKKDGNGSGKHDPSRIEWSACHGKYFCGKFQVPLDHTLKDGEKIDIAVIKFPAKDSKKSLGSILVNPGGPGGSGVELVKRAGEKLAEIFDRRYELIGFDPRGVGESVPIRCFPDALKHRAFDAGLGAIDVSIPGAFENALAHEQVRSLSCAKYAAKILPYLSTASVARDMDLIRHAQGDTLLNYWGFSYGSILGQTYINMFPERVGQMIIDGVVNPNAWGEGWAFWLNPKTKNLDWLQHANEVVVGFATECERAGSERCALAVAHPPKKPYVHKHLESIMEKLDKEPIPVLDALVPGVVNGQTVRYMLFRATYKPDIWGKLAEALHAADKRNGTLLQNMVVQPPEDQCPLYDEPAVESTLGIACSDFPAPAYDPSKLKEEIALVNKKYPIGGFDAAELTMGCAFWPGVAKERYVGPWNKRSNSTVLIIGNTFDPVTPIESARIAASLLPNSVLVEQDGYGHCSLAQTSTCTNEIIRRYFVDKTAPKHKINNCTADAVLFPPKKKDEKGFMSSLKEAEESETISDVLSDIWSRSMF